MSDEVETCAAFVEGAPPGELADVVADIKSLTNPSIIKSLGPAFERYNEEQFITTTLPGSSQPVIISHYNKISDGSYFDVEANSSFVFDHITQKASQVQSYTIEGPQVDLVKSVIKAIGPYTKEHYPEAAYGVYPIDDSKAAIVLVANKYSPNNFWNGRWRSSYVFDSTSGSLDGVIKVDVHYYEDGNVRLLSEKKLSVTITSVLGNTIVKEIAVAEKKYQEELNRGFVALGEGAFKGLRRQLPVTRQKIEWDKVASYRLGQDIGGGSSRR